MRMPPNSTRAWDSFTPSHSFKRFLTTRPSLSVTDSWRPIRVALVFVIRVLVGCAY